MLLPKCAAQEKLPLIICLQGHSTGMHISLGRAVFAGDEETISGGDRDFARQIIARGQAALTIEQRAFGERGGTPKGPDCHQRSVQALLLGRTLIGDRCHDISCAIDAVVENFAQIDTSRIAIMAIRVEVRLRYMLLRWIRVLLQPCLPVHSADFCRPSAHSIIASATTFHIL